MLWERPSLPIRLVLLCWSATFAAAGQQPGHVHLTGLITDRSGAPVQGALVRVSSQSTLSDSAGRYELVVDRGQRRVQVMRGNQALYSITLDLEQNQELDMTLGTADTIVVRAGQDASMADPSTQGYSHSELLEANPGRPGVPLSVPGYPVETASGGIKAPQYFAPGVAGDHGEPVAQFLNIHGFLFQNNLTANAHGNGYADPNFIIGATLGGVLADNAGYNARYGDHSIALAVTYDLRDHVPSFLSLTSDGRDGSISAGWSPKSDQKHMVLSAEAMFGNGILHRPEERQQYKINAIRTWEPAHHQVTLYAAGYYGFSRLPGLIPMDAPVPGDTIDDRQADLTHTAIAVAADTWQIDEKRSLVSGAFFRTYSLALRSNFGDGLIRQSEFRTISGGTSTYAQPLGRGWTMVAGLELRREAPRGLDLARLSAQNTFQPVTSNDVTITTGSPFAAVQGGILPHVRLYLGLRRDQLHFDNVDRLTPANSFTRWPGITSPKVNLTLGEASSVLPQVSFSFGDAFHANDPRIGTGSAPGSLLIKAREFQAVAFKQIAGTALKLTLSKVTNSAELARIDPDTGLQQNLGPSRNRFLTFSAQQRFDRGWLNMSWSAADAHDRQTGQPVPEAPRTIVDATGGADRLPLGLAAKAEFEYVKAKPLGDGFSGVPLREIRLALSRSFADGRWALSIDGQLNSGYSGQTLETLAVGSEPSPRERPVGIPLRSYASVSLRHFFAP